MRTREWLRLTFSPSSPLLPLWRLEARPQPRFPLCWAPFPTHRFLSSFFASVLLQILCSLSCRRRERASERERAVLPYGYCYERRSEKGGWGRGKGGEGEGEWEWRGKRLGREGRRERGEAKERLWGCVTTSSFLFLVLLFPLCASSFSVPFLNYPFSFFVSIHYSVTFQASVFFFLLVLRQILSSFNHQSLFVLFNYSDCLFLHLHYYWNSLASHILHPSLISR